MGYNDRVSACDAGQWGADHQETEAAESLDVESHSGKHLRTFQDPSEHPRTDSSDGEEGSQRDPLPRTGSRPTIESF